jgi:predicted CopG family antitoxin
MSRRCTILVDDEVWEILRKNQANLLQTGKGAVSFSSVCNKYLRRGLRLK